MREAVTALPEVADVHDVLEAHAEIRLEGEDVEAEPVDGSVDVTCGAEDHGRRCAPRACRPENIETGTARNLTPPRAGADVRARHGWPMRPAVSPAACRLWAAAVRGPAGSTGTARPPGSRRPSRGARGGSPS